MVIIIYLFRQVNETMAKEIPIHIDNNKVLSVSIEHLLSYLLENRYPDLKEKKKLRIKLSGDGRKSSKSMPFILFTLTIIEEG